MAVTRETKVKHEIRDYLKIKYGRRALLWHNLQGLGSFVGIPDFMFLCGNKFYLIEVKSPAGISKKTGKKLPAGKLSEKQQAFLGAAETICPKIVVVIVAYSLDDVMKYL